MQLAERSDMIDALDCPRIAVDAWRGESVRVAGTVLTVPGTRRIRLSVVAGNLRIHRLLDRFVEPGSTVVDVGAKRGQQFVPGELPCRSHRRAARARGAALRRPVESVAWQRAR